MDNEAKLCYNNYILKQNIQYNYQVFLHPRRWKKLLTEVKFSIEGNEIPVQVVYSKRKTISLEIKAEGRIIARVPNLLPDKEIRRIIEINKSKLYSKYKEYCLQGNHQLLGAKGYGDIYYNGATLPFVLGDLKLILEKGQGIEESKVFYRRLMDGSRTLTVITISEDSDFIRNCISDWYRKYAKETLTKKTVYYSKLMQTSYNRLTVKEQKTRWGSCSSKGNLNFNWKLMMMPEAAIDYVVVHELAHRKHMNHSSSFWREVEKTLPDYRDRREWLKKNGRYFSIY